MLATQTPSSDGYASTSRRRDGRTDRSRRPDRRSRAKLDARPNRFRSSLRDWIAEATDTHHDIAETVLGHVVGGAVAWAYRRTDFLEQRPLLLERSAKYVTGEPGQVVHLLGATHA